MKSKRYNNDKQKSSTKTTTDMTKINPNTAGIDIGSAFHWVCVNPEVTKNNIRKFGVYTSDIKEMINFFKDCGVTSVAMESTGTYWVVTYEMLEKAGIEAILVNARHLKNVPGRTKTDILDCQWIQRLHSYGLLNGSFHPIEDIRKIRVLKRQKDELVKDMSRDIQHMQKILQLSNIRLDKAVSDISGVSGIKIIKSILNGERNPAVLAKFRAPGVHASEKEIEKALDGEYTEEYIFLLRQAFNSYTFKCSQIEECSAKIDEYLGLYAETKKFSNQDSDSVTHNVEDKSTSSDTKDMLHKILGVDLTQVDGIQTNTATVFVSEVGNDLSKWPTDKHFTSWLGLCPNKEISGGKVLKNRSKKVKNRLSMAFRIAATTMRNSNCYLGVFYRRIRAKSGPCKAITATARKLAVIVYNMVKYQKEYKAINPDFYDTKYQARVVKNLKSRADAMGFNLVSKTV